MWVVKQRVQENHIPRIFTIGFQGISVLNNLRGSPGSLRWVKLKGEYLRGSIVRQLDWYQVWMRTKVAYILWRVRSSLLPMAYRTISSAWTIIKTPDSSISPTSNMHRKKRKGERTIPWGIPWKQGALEDERNFHWIRIQRFLVKFLI